MVDDEARYERRDVRAIRGTEARTIDKWSRQGWELVAQDRGSVLHTHLTFRRPKPKTPWRLMAAAGAGLAIIITLGVVFGDDDEPTPQAQAPASEQPTPRAVDAPTGEDAAKASPKATEEEVVYPDQNVFKFGQTVLYEVRQSCEYAIAGGECEGYYPIEVTVEAPVAYTPSDPAHATQADTVYFTVTIKNLAKLDTFNVNGMPSEAISGLDQSDPSFDTMVGNGTEGDELYADFDQGIGMVEGDDDGDLAPGESASFREGFSVANADDVVYKIRPYGLHGETLFFQR